MPAMVVVEQDRTLGLDIAAQDVPDRVDEVLALVERLNAEAAGGPLSTGGPLPTGATPSPGTSVAAGPAAGRGEWVVVRVTTWSKSRS